MLSKAERRPARADLLPRRIRATVPAHSKPWIPVALRLEFGSLIEHQPSRDGATLNSRARSTLNHSVVPRRTQIPLGPPRPRGDGTGRFAVNTTARESQTGQSGDFTRRRREYVFGKSHDRKESLAFIGENPSRT
jgi:hypothetical protein